MPHSAVEAETKRDQFIALRVIGFTYSYFFKGLGCTSSFTSQESVSFIYIYLLFLWTNTKNLIFFSCADYGEVVT